MSLTAYDVSMLLVCGMSIGWLLATVGYGRALQRVAKLFRDECKADIKDLKLRLQMLESFRGIDQAKERRP